MNTDVSAPFASLIETLAGWFGMAPIDMEIAFWTILVGVVCSASCALVGCFLVLRRMSMLGDAISHAILAGIAIGFLLSGSTSFLPMFVGALVMGLLTAFLTQTLHRFGNVPEDSSMGAVFTSAFAFGVIAISQVDRVHLDADCVLYGAIEYVSFVTVPIAGLHVPRALLSLGLVLLLIVGVLTLLWKELKVASFDPMLASAMGFSANLLHYVLMALVASVTVVSLEAVGAIVVVAMLIVPGATAHLLSDRLGNMLLIAVLVGIISTVAGYVGAVWWYTNAAGMMAVAAGVQLTLAVFLSRRHGLLSRVWHNFRLGVRIMSEDVVARLYRAEERQGETAVIATRRQCAAMAGGGISAWFALPNLTRSGLLTRLSDGPMRLTDKGRRLGQSLVRSHRLWEAYLDRNFELAPDHLHEPAERIEHFIGPELQNRLERNLARPGVDPHGTAIPLGKKPDEDPDET